MNRLWVRLSLAFIVVTQLSVFVVVVFADQGVNGEFRRYVFFSAANQTSAVLVRYYNAAGSWTGVDKVLAAGQISAGSTSASPAAAPLHELLLGRQSSAAGSSSSANQVAAAQPVPADMPFCPPTPPLMLADAQGKVVYDSQQVHVGTVLKVDEQAAAVPINSGTTPGKPLGYILPEMNAPVAVGVSAQPGSNADTLFNTQEQTFLDRMRNTLLVAALAIGALGVFMGLVISRTLVAPLDNLANAARAFAAHDWTCRVKERGASEIASVARAFNQMADELQRAETLRRSLIADIAHELRTPLSVMQANLLALLDGIYPLEKREIATLYEESFMLNRLVDDLRELARADAGQLVLNLGPVDISNVLTTLVSKFSIAAEGDGTQLILEPVAADLCVRADSDRLSQVLGNLIANALRHTPGGSISVAANRTPSAKGKPSMVYVSVSDTGEGIPPCDVPHVFERFYRADKSRSRSNGSSGLGLAIAKAWIEAMGGQIGVESTYGKGSRFWFTLPANAIVDCPPPDKVV